MNNNHIKHLFFDNFDKKVLTCTVFCDILVYIVTYNLDIMKIKFVAIWAAVVVFYLVGIAVNSVVVEIIFNCDMTKTPIWSVEGFFFAAFAGMSAFLAKKVYQKISINE